MKYHSDPPCPQNLTPLWPEDNFWIWPRAARCVLPKPWCLQASLFFATQLCASLWGSMRQVCPWSTSGPGCGLEMFPFSRDCGTKAPKYTTLFIWKFVILPSFRGRTHDNIVRSERWTILIALYPHRTDILGTLKNYFLTTGQSTYSICFTGTIALGRRPELTNNPPSLNRINKSFI